MGPPKRREREPSSTFSAPSQPLPSYWLTELRKSPWSVPWKRPWRSGKAVLPTSAWERLAAGRQPGSISEIRLSRFPTSILPESPLFKEQAPALRASSLRDTLSGFTQPPAIPRPTLPKLATAFQSETAVGGARVCRQFH